MTSNPLTKEEIAEKVGKKSFFEIDFNLAARLNYESGIPSFDQYLDGKTLKEIDAVIHLVKYPKGLVVKIAKNFSSFPFAMSFTEIKRTVIYQKQNISNLIFETRTNEKIIFNFKTSDFFEVKEFFNDINLKFDLEKAKTVPTKKEQKSLNNTKHGIPALLSVFIPGLGQLIKGHFLKAFLIWGSGLFIWFAFFGFLASGQIGISIAIIYLIPVAVWLWNVYDAYNSNENSGAQLTK